MSIREKLKQWKRFAAGATAAVLCAGLLAGCTGKNPAGSSDGTAAQEEPQRYSTIFYDAFDTVTQVIAYCDSEEEFTRQMDALHADLLEYHQLYDIYNDYDGVTNIKTINDNAGTAPVQVDDKILGMLELARQAEHCHGQRAPHLARLPGGRRADRDGRGQQAAQPGRAGRRRPALRHQQPCHG